MNNLPSSSSPRWGISTKLIFGLVFSAIILWLLVTYRNYLGPLILAFVISYLLYPLAVRIRKKIRLPWRGIVTIIYLIVLIIILGLLTWGGFALVDQIQSLIKLLQNALNTLPQFLEELPTQVYTIGPFEFNMGNYDLSLITNQILSSIQPLLGRLGSIIGAIASSAASLLGWLAFILLISYFILAESGGLSGRIIKFDIPGYSEDMNRLGAELTRIWDAFLRGQMILFLITVLLYSIILSSLDLRFAIGLAILAGMARFVPYIGPAVAWSTYALVALFQGHTVFGLEPFYYAVVVVGIALVVDNLFDSFVTPRVMADALKVHPAGVLVSALIAANMIGIIGVFLAAPVLATLKLFVDYGFGKMADRDPWETMAVNPPAPPPPSWLIKIKNWFTRLWNNLRMKTPPPND